MRVIALLNRGGRRVADHGERLEADVCAAFAMHGLEARVRTVPGSELASAARAARHECDALVVGGGDGSVSCVAGVLADGSLPLGVLPLGTLNHFARDLGLPPTLDAAAAVVCAGHVRRVDVAEVNGHVFVNNSSIGVYPRVVADREREQREHGLPKWPAMALAAARALLHYRHRRLTIATERGAVPRRTPLVFVGNNEYLLEFPEMGARARLDGGELCLYVVRGKGPWTVAKIALRAALGSVRAERDLERVRGLERLTVAGRGPRLEVALDGEVETLDAPLVYRIRPQALPVFAPAVAAKP